MQGKIWLRNLKIMLYEEKKNLPPQIFIGLIQYISEKRGETPLKGTVKVIWLENYLKPFRYIITVFPQLKYSRRFIFFFKYSYCISPVQWQV